MIAWEREITEDGRYDQHMNVESVHQLQRSYLEVSDLFDVETDRGKPWAVANDALLLERVLSDVNKNDDSILDFGCGGWPWITNHLYRDEYDVVGLDVHKQEWYQDGHRAELNLPLIGYDGEEIPLATDSFDVVLMFGVLEHVGIWESEESKYRELNNEITDHRRRVLREIDRVLAPGGLLYVTKFPNELGRDKLTTKLLGDSQGHLESERTRPEYLRTLVSEFFSVEEFFANGLLPLRIPVNTSTLRPVLWYANVNDTASNLPVLRQFAQNYCIQAIQTD